jgi:hypothetical protein
VQEALVFGICNKDEPDRRWSEFRHTQSVSFGSGGSIHRLSIAISDPPDRATLLGLLNYLNALALALALVSVRRR